MNGSLRVGWLYLASPDMSRTTCMRMSAQYYILIVMLAPTSCNALRGWVCCLCMVSTHRASFHHVCLQASCH